MKELTPEEKLLHLIRRSEKNTPKEKQTEGVVSQGESGIPKSTPSSVAKKSVKLKDTKIIFRGIKSIDFILINRLILLSVFIVLLLFLFDLYFNSKEVSEPISSRLPKLQKISLKQKEMKPYSFYQEEISKRNLFTSGQLESESKKVVPAGLTFNELMKNLQLLGIVRGDNPQIIIEDKKLNKTYFLYEGDYIGEIKVEEIYSDRVVLQLKGEKISLFL